MKAWQAWRGDSHNEKSLVSSRMFRPALIYRPPISGTQKLLDLARRHPSCGWPLRLPARQARM